MSSKALFVTDWDNISRFVKEVARKNKIDDETREYLKGRLSSSEDHIVLITLSVLDSIVVNCTRGVRDQLATPVWMKILLNCFVGNLSKKHIRDSISQLFSNWRQLLRAEALGQEARNVCKHIQVKNYVVPIPAEYAPEVVTAVQGNRPPTEFFRGYDFYQRVYGIVKEAAATSNLPQPGSSGSAHHSHHSSMSASQEGTSSVRAASSTGQAPPAAGSAAPLAASSAPETPRDKLQRMVTDGDALDKATDACLAAGSKLREASGVPPGGDASTRKALEDALRQGQECDVQCQSWTDAVQRMIDDGMSPDDMMHALEQNERLCSLRERWASIAAHQQQILKAAEGAAAAVSTLAAAAAAANVGSPTAEQASSRSLGLTTSAFAMGRSPLEDESQLLFPPPRLPPTAGRKSFQQSSGLTEGPASPSSARRVSPVDASSFSGNDSPHTRQLAGQHSPRANGSNSHPAMFSAFAEMSETAALGAAELNSQGPSQPAASLPSLQDSVLLVTSSYAVPGELQPASGGVVGNPFASLADTSHSATTAAATAGIQSGSATAATAGIQPEPATAAAEGIHPTPAQAAAAGSRNPFSSSDDLLQLAKPAADVAVQPAVSLHVSNIEHELQQMQAEIAALQESLAEQQRSRQSAEEEAQQLRRQVMALIADGDCLRTQLSDVQAQLSNEQQQVKALQQRLLAESAAAPTQDAGQDKAVVQSEQAATSQRVTSRTHSALEWTMLAAPDARLPVEPSAASVSARTFSINDGASHGRGKGTALRSLFRKDSFSAAATVQAVAPASVGEAGLRDNETAAMLAAYRRMPALRVRFTPQHFANLVTTVAEDWQGLPHMQEAA